MRQGEHLFIRGDFREYKWKEPQEYKGSISFIKQIQILALHWILPSPPSDVTAVPAPIGPALESESTNGKCCQHKDLD